MGCTFLPVPVEIRETRGLETVVDDRVAGGKELGWDAAQFEQCVEVDLAAEGVVAEFRGIALVLKPAVTLPPRSAGEQPLMQAMLLSWELRPG